VRASRLLQVLLLLQARGPMSAPQLAEELEVSVRTVYRDLEALGAAGVPVYSEPGRHGGARLVDGWRTRLTGLTGEEADTLPLLGMPAAAAELGLGSVLAAAELKVLAALPPELRSRARRVAERFHLDVGGWFHRNEPVPHLAAVAEAVWDDRRLRIGYRRSDEVVERTIDPLGLVLKAGTWYLVASHRGRPLTYRVSRITALDVLDERFDRARDFDLIDHWAASSAAFEDAMFRIEVRLRMRTDELGLLRLVLDPVSQQRVVSEPDPDGAGWSLVRFPGESVEVVYRSILFLGGAAEVLAPDDLRRRVAAGFAEAAAVYAGDIASASRAATSR
jgi:predicted DNA-binding transcriptional regulator YafY